MEWMLLPLRRYADFQGRSCRKEYWMFVLFQLLVMLVIGILTALVSAIFGQQFAGWTFAILAGLFFLGILIPGIAVQVRRFHDQDKSGWFVLLSLIPYLGGIIVFVFMCLRGTQGSNRFGADPLGQDNVADVFN